MLEDQYKYLLIYLQGIDTQRAICHLLVLSFQLSQQPEPCRAEVAGLFCVAGTISRDVE